MPVSYKMMEIDEFVRNGRQRPLILFLQTVPVSYNAVEIERFVRKVIHCSLILSL